MTSESPKIDHLAIAVPDIDAALAFYRDALGLTLTAVEDVANEGVRVAFLALGDSHIELVQPTAPDTGIARWMAKNTQGMHHVCVEVDVIDDALARLAEHGAELINPQPISKSDGTRYAFVHPRSASGVLVELYQRPRVERAGAADCIFCKIMAGQVQGSIVYRDALCTAFMDIQPVNPGHVLVVPNEHVADLTALDSRVGGRLFDVARRIVAAYPNSEVRHAGANLFLANGAEAGQEVFHVHLHVFPRFTGDGFRLKHGPDYNTLPSRDSLDAVAKRIRSALA
jgi:methylmalonyl-CoA epimerase